MNIKNTLLLSILAFAVVGCNNVDPKVTGAYPADYKTMIKKHIESKFLDPYSLRNVSISSPVQGITYFQQGWISCVEANAKNRMGGYTGLSKTAFIFRSNTIKAMESNSLYCNKNHLVYEKWIDMESKQ